MRDDWRVAFSRRALVTCCLVFFGCSGPEEEVPFVYPANADQEGMFPYSASAEADLTGDGVPETLRLAASSGPTPMDITVSFSIWSDDREIYRRSWDSGGYFKYEPELVMAGDEPAMYAHVRDHLDPFLDASSFMVFPAGAVNADHTRQPFDAPDMDNDPVQRISYQLVRPVLMDSLLAVGMDSTSALRQARSLVRRRVHPEARGIWEMMIAEELPTFTFNSGGEATQRIAWSQAGRRFFEVWACC